jgi:hypothetical protein
MTFDVSKDMRKQNNKATVEVYNMSKDSRDQITSIGQKFRVMAGYEGNVKQLYYGDLLDFAHEFSGTEVITKFSCQNKSLTEQKVAVFAGKNQDAFELIKKTCKDAGIVLKDAVFNKLKTKFLAGGYSEVSKVKDVYDELAQYTDTEWANNDDEIIFIQKGGYLENLNIFLSSQSGLLGIPTKVDDIVTHRKKDSKDAPGYIINTLLMPELVPGYLVNVESKAIGLKSGCVIHSVEHKGDTHGSDWSSKARVTLLK